MKERTFAFLKPEAVMRGLIGTIIARIERKGLNLIAMKLLRLTRDQAQRIYSVHKGKSFYESLVNHVTSGPILAMVIEGPNAISVLRSMIGKTNPEEARPGTIRGDFALITGKNIIHAADSPENALKEMKVIFGENELFEYEKPTEAKYLL